MLGGSDGGAGLLTGEESDALLGLLPTMAEPNNLPPDAALDLMSQSTEPMENASDREAAALAEMVEDPSATESGEVVE